MSNNAQHMREKPRRGSALTPMDDIAQILCPSCRKWHKKKVARHRFAAKTCTQLETDATYECLMTLLTMRCVTGHDSNMDGKRATKQRKRQEGRPQAKVRALTFRSTDSRMKV
jgi:hypothetical protein